MQLTAEDDEDYQHLQRAIEVAHKVVAAVDTHVAHDHEDQVGRGDDALFG